MNHGTTKEGVKFYKEMLENLWRTSAANFDLLEIAWDEWATKSDFAREWIDQGRKGIGRCKDDKDSEEEDDYCD